MQNIKLYARVKQNTTCLTQTPANSISINYVHIIRHDNCTSALVKLKALSLQLNNVFTSKQTHVIIKYALFHVKYTWVTCNSLKSDYWSSKSLPKLSKGNFEIWLTQKMKHVELRRPRNLKLLLKKLQLKFICTYFTHISLWLFPHTKHHLMT